jgi:hypothetical protein
MTIKMTTSRKPFLRIIAFLLAESALLLSALLLPSEAFSQMLQPFPRTLNFGAVIVGQSTTQVITLSAGKIVAPLVITPPAGCAVSVSGETGRFFTTTTTCLLGSSAAITLTVRFSPVRTGRVEEPLVLKFGNAGFSLSMFVQILGEGIAPSPATVRFVHERLYVRDEPFFPIGWSQIGTRDNYGIIGQACQRKELRGVNFVENEGTAGSMNVGAEELHSIWKTDARDYNNPDTVRHYLRRYLDTCQKGGVKTILNLYEYYVNKQISGVAVTNSTTTGKAGATIYLERKLTDADIQAIIGDSAISNHPALLGWWISSEPVGKYGQVFSTFYDGKKNPYSNTLKAQKNLAEINAQVSKFYPLQTELSRLYRLAKQADGFKHPIGTMFQTGSMLEMTGMLNLYANPDEPFWDFALAEHYNAYTPHDKKTGLYYEVFERLNPLADSLHIKNADADGNFYYRNFRSASPITGLTQDDRLMNRDVRDYYTRFQPSGTRDGVSGGGLILKMFGHKYEGDTDQGLRPATLRELMFTTFTEIHALQNYPRPTVLGGIDLFGFDFYSSKILKTDANGIQTSVWGLTPHDKNDREEQQTFLAFIGTHNLGIVFQSPIIREFQDGGFAKVQVVGEKDSISNSAAAQAIKQVVRYHHGYYYLALINNRLNETMPPSLTTGTKRFTGWGVEQEFITTHSVRLSLPASSVITSCVELLPNADKAGFEQQHILQNTAEGAQMLALDKLDAAETRVFRFRAVSPTVQVQIPIVEHFSPKKTQAKTATTTKKKSSKTRTK